jgi:hypothetical protein
MVILPYVKLGTVPYGPARVKSKRSLPVVGDVIFIKENNDKSKYQNPWKKVRVDMVKNEEVYFVSGAY